MPGKHPRLERFAQGGIPPEMKPMAGQVLITGSSGMLGIDLCEELAGDYEVYGADLVANKNFICDITDRKSISDVITKVKPDVVIHTAAWTDVDGCELVKNKAYRINSIGAENVALGCKAAGAALIYISTDFVFDGKKKSAYKETDRPNPLSVYADSKFKGEEAVKKAIKNYFIIRTSWLYGKNGKNFVDTIIEKSKTDKELRVVDDQVGSPTYTVDFAKAIHVLLDRVFVKREASSVKRYGIYHITNSGSVSWYEYAKTILGLTGSDSRALPISSKELNRPAKRPAMSVLDNSKFIALTGYRMRNWKTALKEYLSGRESYAEKIERENPK